MEDVNQALYDFGMAMGPLAMGGDLAGLGVGWRVRKEFKHLEKPGVRVPLVSDRLCEMGRFGQKTGRGVVPVRRKSPAFAHDPETAALIEEAAREAGIEQRITREEIVDRCIFALVNEGARVLGEGIALRAADIDVVYLNGYAFPAWQEAPCFTPIPWAFRPCWPASRNFGQRHGDDLLVAGAVAAASGRKRRDFQRSG